MQKEQNWIEIDNERFYFKEVDLFPGRKVIDIDISKENLEIFHSIIERSKITYGIIFGTLLGAIREKNFIKYDEDTDIYLLYEEREKFLRLLVQFQQKGFDLVRSQGDILSLMRKNEYIDFYFYKRKLRFGLFKRRVFSNKLELPANNLENPIKKLFLGINISMPDNPEYILHKLYGRNWKIPLRNKIAEPNTFYSKISKMSTRLRGLPFYGKLELGAKSVLARLGL